MTFNNFKSSITTLLMILTFIGACAGFAIKITNRIATLEQAKIDMHDDIIYIRNKVDDINDKLDKISNNK